MSAASKKPALGLSLFTVQQIELIRRLRNSGLTKEQVGIVYDSLEQIDSDLGNVYTVPASLFKQSNGVIRTESQTPQVRPNDGRIPQPGTQQSQSVFPEAMQHSGILAGSSSGQSSWSPHAVAVSSTNGQPAATGPHPTALQCQATDSGSAATHVNRRFPMVRRFTGTEVKLEPEDSFDEGEEAMGPTAPCSALISEINSLGLDTFLKKGTEKMHEEISEFLSAHPALVHSNIGEATGVDATSVNNFLIGNFPAISPGALYRLCQWFLTRRRQQQQSGFSTDFMDPSYDMLKFDHSMGMGVGVGMGGVASEPEGLVVNFTPRRERFTFRTQHLEVLEAVFKSKQYPTYTERVDIAQRCNDSVEMVFGRALGEKECMTPQNVAYWFSNRRKDIKRMAREGGVDMSSVVLPSRVRHCLPLFSMLDKDTAILNPATTAKPHMPTVPSNFSPLGLPHAGATPILSGGATPILSGGATPILPGGATPILPRAATGATPILPGEATPILPGEATPILPGEATPILPGGATPILPSILQTSNSETVPPASCVKAALSSVEESATATPDTANANLEEAVSSVLTNGGGGSVVDRIASAITSHLMGRSGDVETAPPVSAAVTAAACGPWPAEGL
ncbi:hypothetical protein ACOMHN_021593 [Nucella lapillus]